MAQDQIIKIPKKSGGYRNVYVQRRGITRWKYRHLGYQIDQKINEKPESEVLHGFRPNRSPVTMALKHVGFVYTLSMDLKDFFDSVTLKHLLAAGFDKKLSESVLISGKAMQGMSSSPAAANYAGLVFDKKILEILPNGFVYTRYADDLCVSGNDKDLIISLINKIINIVDTCGFKINNKKTRLQSQIYGNRIICGISVGQTGISIPKRIRKRLRAMKHKHNGLGFVKGLEEWCKLKVPNADTKKELGKWDAANIRIISREMFPVESK